jgi:hypothetical protein
MVVGADRNDNIWAGGVDYLLSEGDNYKTVWSKQFPPLGDRITDIELANHRNAIWVVTPERGLLRVRVSHGRVLGVELMNEVLPSPVDNIQSVYAEPDGIVWLATNRGVLFFDKSLKVNSFNEKNGLSNNDVNDILVVGDTLWAATVYGLSSIPLQRQQEQFNFSSHFAGLRYHSRNSSINVDLFDSLVGQREIFLPSDATLFEIDFAGFYYKTKGNFLFEYISHEDLLPLSQMTWGNLFRWITNKSDTMITADANINLGAHVHPGRHFTKLTAILPGGIRSAQPDTRIFTFTPFWWQTIWFSLLILGCVTTAIVWAYRTRITYQKMKYAMLELQLQAIKAQINPHFVGNSINAIQQFFYPPDPLKASQYVVIFSDLLSRTMLFSEKNFITLREEMVYLKDYLDMIALRFGERFTYEIRKADNISGNTLFPSMLLQPILENATLHGLAPEGVSLLVVDFKSSGNQLKCSITDNGVGITTSRERKKSFNPKRPSKGLFLLQKKIDTLNQLYKLDLKMEISDLSKQQLELKGTQVEILFTPGKISTISN